MRLTLVFLLCAACAAASPRPDAPAIPGLETAAKPGRLVILGEIHGTAEAPAFVADAACQLARQARVHVGLELPAADNPALEAFLFGNEDPLLGGATFRREYQDGRTSQAMLGLLRKLRAARRSGLSIEVFFFDDPDRLGIEHRDEAMAENIAAQRARAPSDIFLIEVGNYHAKTSPGAPWDVSRHWMASYLVERDKSVVTLDVRGPVGTSWVCYTPKKESCGVHKGGTAEGRALPPGPVKRSVILGGALDGYDGIFVVESLTASPPAVAR
jgi:hypothetical protein